MTALQPRDLATRRAYPRRGLIAGLVGLGAAAIVGGGVICSLKPVRAGFS